jgi:choline dehydrogenase
MADKMTIVVLQAWNFHPPSAKLASQFNIKYDTKYWGNSSNVHASFPTDNYPVLSMYLSPAFRAR